MPLQLHPVWIIQFRLAGSTPAGLNRLDDPPSVSEFLSRTSHSMMLLASERGASHPLSLWDFHLCMGLWVEPCPCILQVVFLADVHLERAHLMSVRPEHGRTCFGMVLQIPGGGGAYILSCDFK